MYEHFSECGSGGIRTHEAYASDLKSDPFDQTRERYLIIGVVLLVSLKNFSIPGLNW